MSEASTPTRGRSTPILSECNHRGVPKKYVDDANLLKERFDGNRTLCRETPRREDLPVLPPGVERGRFNAAIEELKGILSPQHVVLNDQSLDDGWYFENPNTHDAHHLMAADLTVSSAAVYPGSTEDVSNVVKWANRYEIPLWPISMGRNLGYGGAAPRVRGSIVVDLGKRMNKVINIDPEQLSCLVEPGVSYLKLHDEIQKSGYPLWVDSPSVGGGSVLGNTMERGVGFTRMADHFANHCGFEVVLPDGEVIRTGMGALPGPYDQMNSSWQAYQYGFGPYIDGIFTQSNFGIVTKMGLWLMQATGHLSLLITFPRDDDLADIVEITKLLMASHIIENSPSLSPALEEVVGSGQSRREIYQGDGPIPKKVLRQYLEQLPCGECAWVLSVVLYGSETQLPHKLAEVRQQFSQIQGTRFLLEEDLPPDHFLHSWTKICTGVPDIQDIDCLNWVQNGAHIWFSPICPSRRDDIRKLWDIVDRLFQEYGMELHCNLGVATREVHFIFGIFYDLGNVNQKRGAHKLIRRLIDECAVAGYGVYRTHILLADHVAQTYSWNDHALLRFHETLKDAIDSKGIIAPGRGGIWPKKYRDQGWNRQVLPDDKAQDEMLGTE